MGHAGPADGAGCLRDLVAGGGGHVVATGLRGRRVSVECAVDGAGQWGAGLAVAVALALVAGGVPHACLARCTGVSHARRGLADLAGACPLHGAAPRILDAGCGMGDALRELHQAYPHADLEGVEWSWLWRAVAAWRCRSARVRRGDMWADDWSAFDLVYLFQRPETMPRALAKARAEMRPGSWLVSLEFAAVDEAGRIWPADAHFTQEGGRPVWVYRMGSARQG